MTFLWITTSVLGLIIIFLIYWYANKRANYWKDLGVPHVKSLPFFGSVTDLFMGRKTMAEILTEIYKELEPERYGGFNITTRPLLLIRDPELINQVLIKDFAYFQDRMDKQDENLELFNAGIINLSGERWRLLRHKLTPTFTSGKMKMMFTQIKECCDDVVKYLKEKKSEDLESRNMAFNAILNIIASIAFGIKANAFTENAADEFVKNSRGFFKSSVALQVKFIISLISPKLKNVLKLTVINSESNAFFITFTKDLIEQREKLGIKRNDFLQLMLDQKAKELAAINSPNGIPHGNDAFIDDADDPDDKELLDQLKRVELTKDDTKEIVFTDRIIAAQTLLFIAGGSETVAGTLSFCLYYLAVNPDVQKRLQREIDDVISSSSTYDYQAVKKMTYLEQVLNEVLRFRPPIGLLNRLCAQDYKLPGTNLVIKKDSLVSIPVLQLHMDPKYFPEPDKFNPDRFENMDSIPKGVYFPFGGGPRMCIAMRLAMLEMKVFISTVLKSFNVVLSPKTKEPLKVLKTSVLQHIDGGLWIRFEERKV